MVKVQGGEEEGGGNNRAMRLRAVKEDVRACVRAAACASARGCAGMGCVRTCVCVCVCVRVRVFVRGRTER